MNIYSKYVLFGTIPDVDLLANLPHVKIKLNI